MIRLVKKQNTECIGQNNVWKKLAWENPTRSDVSSKEELFQPTLEYMEVIDNFNVMRQGIPLLHGWESKAMLRKSKIPR